MDILQKTFSTMQKKNIPLAQNVSFQKLTTFGTGGEAYLALYPQNIDQLKFVAKYLVRHKVKHCFVGHGSNVLASDDYYNGVVVVTTGVKSLCVNGQDVIADCGLSTSKLCAELVKHGLSGGEFFGCIPATVGGAVVCNAGCFSQNVQQVVQAVTVLCGTKIKRLTKQNCQFKKRNSLFKNNPKYVVLQAEMRFPKSSSKQVEQTLSQMRQIKMQTQPLGCRSAGCVLYSERAPVSKLIEQAGLKGFKLGDAQVSEKHAGFVINLDKATSKDIYLLIEYVKNTVATKFGVVPQTEVCLINF